MPERNTKITTISMSPELHARAADIARTGERSFSALVRIALTAHIDALAAKTNQEVHA